MAFPTGLKKNSTVRFGQWRPPVPRGLEDVFYWLDRA